MTCWLSNDHTSSSLLHIKWLQRSLPSGDHTICEPGDNGQNCSQDTVATRQNCTRLGINMHAKVQSLRVEWGYGENVKETENSSVPLPLSPEHEHASFQPWETLMLTIVPRSTPYSNVIMSSLFVFCTSADLSIDESSFLFLHQLQLLHAKSWTMAAWVT